jgi:stage II sporulation protein P
LRKILFIFICCILIFVGAYRFCDFKIKDGAGELREILYEGIYTFFIPQMIQEEDSVKQLAYLEMEKMMFPALSDSRLSHKNGQEQVGGNTSGTENTESSGNTEENTLNTENTESIDNTEKISETEKTPDTEENTETVEINIIADTRKVIINREKLKDFDYLRHNFYQVDNTTTVDSTLLDVTRLLEVDVSITDKSTGPQVLLYHTHANEGYVGSQEGDEALSVLAVGDYLEQLLSEKGIRVLHHKGEYDAEDRNHAYSYVLPVLEEIIAENPSIEVVIDLHRDGVPESLHLVTDIEGRPTAKIMFFNGLSKTTAQGELKNLPNPYIQNNLALSLQLQLAAEEYYPGWARKIYLKGFRYNQHLCSKSLLVEVGAQNNTFEEAKNAMIPLADILEKVLIGQNK